MTEEAKSEEIDLRTQKYTDKSFVVRGDSTREFRGSLKALGGKWNSRLRDKEGNTFGAWLFWKEKEKEVKAWLEKGCKTIIPPPPQRDNLNDSLKQSLEQIHGRLKRIEALLQRRDIQTGSGSDSEVIEDSDDNRHPRPRRRLLQ